MNLSGFDIAAIVGILTIIFGVVVKVIGFPAQIRNNLQRKSTKGLSTTFMVLSFIAYVLWTLHGLLQKDSVLVIGQGIGVITTGIILYQIWLYRKN
ncbi:MAG TPA: PQ-loop repeat-containing protein [Candidatus Nanoarchaeia archaeon]|nr:hypothetical protein [uncultured archaeon]